MELIDSTKLKTQIYNLTAEYDTETVHIDALADLIDNQPTVNAIPVEKLEQIREEIELEKLGYPPSAGYYKAIMKVLDIIDKELKE